MVVALLIIESWSMWPKQTAVVRWEKLGALDVNFVRRNIHRNTKSFVWRADSPLMDKVWKYLPTTGIWRKYMNWIYEDLCRYRRMCHNARPMQKRTLHQYFGFLQVYLQQRIQSRCKQPLLCRWAQNNTNTSWPQINSDIFVDINECLQAPSPCEHKCHNNEGSFTCSCPIGYLLNPDGLTCRDLDECEIGQHVCQHTCVNTLGSYSCSCPKGYTQIGDDCQGSHNKTLLTFCHTIFF